MKVTNHSTFTLVLNQEEFEALYQFLGSTSIASRRESLKEYENAEEKAHLLDAMWDELDAAA